MSECACGYYSQPMLVARIIRFAFNVAGTFLILFMLTTIGLLLMVLAAATKIR